MNLEILEEYIKQEWAPDFHYAHYENIPWTPFRKTSNTACVALVTTGGVHLRQDPPFAGIDDASYREIPGTAQATDLTVSHPFFDSTELEQDIDAIFPLTRLRELQSAGVIRRVAPQHFSFMGVVPHWGPLEGTAKEVAEKLVTAGVDAVILTPGSPICNHSLAIIQRVLEGAGLATIALTIEPELMKLCTGASGDDRGLSARVPGWGADRPRETAQGSEGGARVSRDHDAARHGVEIPV